MLPIKPMRNPSAAGVCLPGVARAGGFSLPMVLMFLVVISLLATVGLRRATLGETMSRNQIEYEIARQSAEAALRDGERDLSLINQTMQPGAYCARNTDRPLTEGLAVFQPTCVRGQCYVDDKSYDNSSYGDLAKAQPWWPEDKGGLWGGKTTKPTSVNDSKCGAFAGSVPLGTFTGTVRIPGVDRQPEYLMEQFPRGDKRIFRITARGFGYTQNSEIVLQTYFKPPEITVLN